jgi:hypothetical protein
MASTGNVFPTVGANVDRAGNTAWTNPGNVVSDNATDATVAVPSDYLVTSSYGFTVPSSAVIRGVTVRVEASETGTGSSSYIPQLHSNTTPTLIGAAKSAVTVTGTTPVISTNGGAADLWSATLTPSDVNASGFGVTIWSTDTTNTLAVDFITIAIEYEDQAIVAAGSASITGAAVLNGPGTLVAAGSASITGAAALTGAGDVVAAGSLAISGDARPQAGMVVSRLPTTFGPFLPLARGSGSQFLIVEPTSDVVAVGSLTINGAGSLSGTGSIVAAGSVAITSVAALSAQGDIQAAGTVSISGVASPSGSGSLIGVGSVAINGAAALGFSDASIAAAGLVSISGLAVLGDGSITAPLVSRLPTRYGPFLPPIRQSLNRELLATEFAIQAVGSISISGVANLNATGQLVAAGSLAITGVAPLASQEASAAGSLSIAGAAVLNAVGALVAAGSVAINGVANLLGTRPLIGRPSKQLGPYFLLFRRATGATRLTDILRAAGSVAVVGAASLSASGALAAAGSVSISGNADLVGSSSDIVATSTVSITGNAGLTASGDVIAAGSASISGAAVLIGTGTVVAAGSLVIVGANADLVPSDVAISALGTIAINGAADLAAIGSLSAAGSLVVSGSAVLLVLPAEHYEALVEQRVYECQVEESRYEA